MGGALKAEQQRGRSRDLGAVSFKFTKSTLSIISIIKSFEIILGNFFPKSNLKNLTDFDKGTRAMLTSGLAYRNMSLLHKSVLLFVRGLCIPPLIR